MHTSKDRNMTEHFAVVRQDLAYLSDLEGYELQHADDE